MNSPTRGMWSVAARKAGPRNSRKPKPCRFQVGGALVFRRTFIGEFRARGMMQGAPRRSWSPIACRALPRSRESRTWIQLGAFLALLVSGCHGFEPTVRRSMAGEAKCPEDKVAVKSLPGGGYAAEGCGKSAVYDCAWPDGGTRVCSRRGAPAPATMPGTGW